MYIISCIVQTPLDVSETQVFLSPINYDKKLYKEYHVNTLKEFYHSKLGKKTFALQIRFQKYNLDKY